MGVRTAINCAGILVGAIIMLVSIFRVHDMTNALSYVPERQRKPLSLYLAAHRGLMLFFFLGYLAVLLTIGSGRRILGDTFVSAIFFFGAIFVFIGISVQSRLLGEIQQTLQGLLPICAHCKKIRGPNGQPEDPKAWKPIEVYISERVDVQFSHGYCPGCFNEVVRNMDKTEGKI
ncbi:MAG: hypothetical protein AAB320_03885 [Elusimicrobiota bacterium]